MANQDEFIPEELDEQNRELIQGLQRLYNTSSADTQSLERIRERLHLSATSSPTKSNKTNIDIQRETSMSLVNPTPIRQVRRPQLLVALVAVLLIALVSGSLIFFLNLENNRPTSNTGPHPIGSATQQTATIIQSTHQSSATPTISFPQTQVSCPDTGTGRAAVFQSLTTGSNKNLVYRVIEFTSSGTTSTLKRYDLVTGQKTEIVKLPNVAISEAQVSTDGQWLLFVSTADNNTRAPGAIMELQMVRMDGKGLQTLYCGRYIQNVVWSANQKLIAFNTSDGLYILHTATGAVELEVAPVLYGPPTNGSTIAQPRTWLDNTRLYVNYSSTPVGPLDTLALLDTNQGANQQLKNLPIVFQWVSPYLTYNYPSYYPCWDADSSYDGSELFISECGGIAIPKCSSSCPLATIEGPGSIRYMPPTGGNGKQSNIFTNLKMGIKNVRSISSQTLLFEVGNFSENQTVDTSQNGLWTINTDGTHLTRLTMEAPNELTNLNPFSQSPWANVSRDGTMYAVQTSAYTGTLASPHFTTQSLLIGSLQGGAPATIASIADGTQLTIVGWTTM